MNRFKLYLVLGTVIALGAIGTIPQFINGYLTGVTRGDSTLTITNHLDHAVCELSLRKDNGYTFWTKNYLNRSSLNPGESIVISNINKGSYQGKARLCDRLVRPHTHVNKFEVSPDKTIWLIVPSQTINY